MPGWQLARLCKRSGITQWAIAEKANVSQATVAKAIYRRGSGAAIERVWVVLESVLT